MWLQFLNLSNICRDQKLSVSEAWKSEVERREGFGSFAPGSAYIIWKLCSWVCIYNITPSTARDEAVWELEESGNKIAHRWKGSLYFKSSET